MAKNTEFFFLYCTGCSSEVQSFSNKEALEENLNSFHSDCEEDQLQVFVGENLSAEQQKKWRVS